MSAYTWECRVVTHFFVKPDAWESFILNPFYFFMNLFEDLTPLYLRLIVCFHFMLIIRRKKYWWLPLFFLPNIVIQLYSWENFMSFYFILLVVENWKTAEIAHKSPTTEITLFILTLAQQYSLVIRTTKRGQKAMYTKNAWRYHL